MLELFSLINTIADYPTRVLLVGETGTGKELVARALHNNRNSERKGNFVDVNCAGIPSALLESEMFGHVRGAFTDAHTTTEGKFQATNNGTIFLDEIGDIHLDHQAKLLRAIELGVIYKVGSRKPEPITARIVCATNKNLEDAVSRGDFREDLYYRVNVLRIRLPPLRERPEDIPHLVKHFINHLNPKYNAHVDGFTDGALRKLMNYSWPGNVRDLANVVERTLVARNSGMITPDNIVFDGDAPKLITRRLTEGLWFSDGFVPIAHEFLYRTKDLSREAVDYLLQSGRVYSVEFGSYKKHFGGVAFLTYENLREFFPRPNKTYDWLQRELDSGAWLDRARSPFGIFTAAELISKNLSFTNKGPLLKAVDDLKLALQGPEHGRCSYIVLPEESIDGLIPHSGRASGQVQVRRDAFKSEILDQYGRFYGWKPLSASKVSSR
jgi:hypothetical protein